ncbi:hypothetical protein EBGED10_44650 [Bacillus sp. GeD10]|nr:hypothetical protein EBGED10_44650 [Bacillus sp. GeD10]
MSFATPSLYKRKGRSDGIISAIHMSNRRTQYKMGCDT